MINLCQDGISIFGKSDSIDYCDFHYHGITIIETYCPSLCTTTTFVHVHVSHSSEWQDIHCEGLPNSGQRNPAALFQAQQLQ